MFINDVGQSTWEEINDGIAGSNYGWPITEGITTNPAFRSPVFVYGHGSDATTGCAIAGAAFYNPATVQFPSSFVGKYFFADLCSGWIRVFDPATGTASGFATNVGQPVDLKVTPDGSLYYLSIASASLFKIQFTDPVLLTEQNSDLAIALDSVTMVRDPFPLTNVFNFSADRRTRLMLFGMNLNLLPGEVLTARAEDAALNVYPLTVEFVGKVPGFDWLTEVVVRLPDNTPAAQSIFVSVTLHGRTSNKARVRMT
jgi:hypothetical protein